MNSENTVIMQEGQIEELRTKVAQLTETNLRLRKALMEILELARACIPKEMLDRLFQVGL